MERNEDLRNDETERAAELQDAELRRGDRGDEGYTNFDSLVRDDSLVAGRTADVPADRTQRASSGVIDHDVVHHDDAPSVGDHVGEAAGGISGVLAGAALGSIGGPIGTVIGGIAGAIGGWWTGRAISEAASNFSHADDEEFRTDYESRTEQQPSDPSRSYERVRPAYQLGYLASRNPEYAGRSFDDIEPHLERGWTGNAATEGSDWNDMRDYARTAYVRGAASQSSLTGDSSAKDSLSSTGTTGSIGIGSDAPHSDPSGTTARSSSGTTSFASGSSGVSSSSGASSVSGTSSARSGPSARDEAMTASSATQDAASRLASPKGSSFTRQGDVPLNTGATDTSGTIRSQDTEKQATQETDDLRGSEPNRGPSFTDPVAGEGVENIGSSGVAPRGDQGTLNQQPKDERERNTEDGSHTY